MPTLCRCLLALFLLTPWMATADQEKPSPLQVEAPKASEPVRIDGMLVDPIWQVAPALPVNFTDKGMGVPIEEVKATVQIAWDDYYLYIGYRVEDPNVQAASNGEVLGPENNRRPGVLAHPDKPNDFVEFFISFEDPNFFWEIHHDAANNFNDVWCTVPEKDWKLHGSTMHRWGIHFAHREYIEDDEPFTMKKAVSLVDGKTRRRSTLNDDTDEDWGWTGEIRLPWRSIGAPKSRESRIRPYQENQHFTIPGPWNMEGVKINLLTVLHRGELPERYYHNSPSRRGNWFHFTHDHWPVYTLTATPPAEETAAE